jgi:tetratricopeptide (TPR) repeat protein
MSPEPFWFSFYENQDVKLGDILEKLAAYMKAPEITAFKLENREPGKIDVDKLIGELNNMSEIWLFFDDLNIILEDTKFSDKGIELLFSSLRYNTHEANIIITSRILPKLRNGESLIDVVEGEEKQHLNGLRTDFAVDYLVKNGLGSLELDKLKELADGVDGHPLALKLLVELVKDYGVGDILEDLSLYKEQTKDTILKARKLFEKLAGDEKGLLERISVYREPVGMKGLKKMFTETTSPNAVKKLIDKSLLETDHKGNYWLHPLVQEFAYDDLEDKKGAHKLAMEYYLSLPLLQKPVKKEDVRHLIEAHYHACMAEEYDQAFDIIFDNNLYEYLDLWGNYTLLIDLYSKLLPEDHLGNEILLKDKGNHGVILGNLGTAYFNLAEPKKAIEYYEKALRIAQEIGDRRGEGIRLGNMGNAYLDLGELKKAIEYYKQALKIDKEIGDRRGESADLRNMGNTYRDLGERKKAIEYYEKALRIAQEIGDRQGDGNSLRSMGLVYSDLGERKKAIEYYEKALRIAQKIGDKRGEGADLGNLGTAYFNLAEPKKAIEYYEQALKIDKEIGDRRGESADLRNMGNAYHHLGERKKAIEYYEKALRIAQEIGDRRGESADLGNMGNAYHHLGERKRAIEYYEKALRIAQEIEYTRLIDFCEKNLEDLKKSKR